MGGFAAAVRRWWWATAAGLLLVAAPFVIVLWPTVSVWLGEVFGADRLPAPGVVAPRATLADFITEKGSQRAPLEEDALVRRCAAQALAAACVQAVEGRPRESIPLRPDSYTQRRHRDDRLAWRRRILLQAYDRHGSKNPAWDTEVRAFLTGMAERVESDSSQDLLDKLVTQSTDLLAKGCDDPCIVYCHGNVLQHAKGRAVAEPFLRRGLERLEPSRYPRLFVYQAAVRLTYLVRDLVGAEAPEAVALNRKSFRYLGEAAGDWIYRDGNQRYYWEDFTALVASLPWAADLPLVEITLQALAATPAADPWIAAMVRARYWRERGWLARGTGWADSVTKEGWEGFHTGLRTASDACVRAYELHPEFPEAAAELVSLTMAGAGQDGVSLHEWFNRAVSAQVDYAAAYSYLLNALRPRWGGSHTSMYSLGLACLETRRFDTSLPMWYLRAVAHISEDLGEGNSREAWRAPGVYRHAREVIDGCLAAPRGDDAAPAYYQSLGMLVAWAAGDYREAARFRTEVGERFDHEVYTKRIVFAEPGVVCRQIDMGSGLLGDAARQARELLDAGDLVKALPLVLQAFRGNSSAPAHKVMVYNEVAGYAKYGFPEPLASAELTADILIELGCRERLLLAYRSLTETYDMDRTAPAFAAKLKAAVGPCALAFLPTVPPRGRYGVADLERALQRIAGVADRYRAEQRIRPDSPEDVEVQDEQALAELRWLTQAAVEPKEQPCDKYCGRFLSPRYCRVRALGRLLDFLTEQMSRHSGGDVLMFRLAECAFKEAARPPDLDAAGVAAVLGELEAVRDDSALVAACWRRYWERGGVRLTLEMAQLLRRRHLVEAAARLETKTSQWLTQVLDSRGRCFWSLWQVMAAYNRVAGYEDETVRYADLASSYKGMNSPLYMKADALLRKGDATGAAAALVQGRRYPDDADVFYSPRGVFAGTSPYVGAILADLVPAKGLHPDWLPLLRQSFPAEFPAASRTAD